MANAMAAGIKSEKGDRRLSGGFTLIEVLIVVGLIFIVGVIVVPTFQRIVQNGNLRSAARNIAADFALHKERAVSQSKMYRITFDVTGNNYSIRECTNSGSVCGGWASIRVKSLGEFGKDIAIQSDKTTESDYYIQTRGTVTAGKIGLGNQRGSDATITINITGKASVQFTMQ